MDYKNQKTKNQKQIKTKNILESINEIGSETVKTAANEVKLTSEEFFRQLLGQQKKRFEEQIFFERRLFSEEKQETEKKIQELRLRLQAVSVEALKLASSTANLNQEVKVAVMQNPANASEYQISFFENIIKLISDFRKKIDSAVTWMQGASRRAEKKNSCQNPETSWVKYMPCFESN